MISALIAYRPTEDGWRDRAWRHIVKPYLESVCGEVIVESPGPGANPGDFNKPLAINNARRRADGSVLLVGDADTLPGDIPGMRALLRVSPWVIPMRYSKLTRRATERALAGDNTDPEFEWVGSGVSWSGGVLCRARDFDNAGGFDERIAWWGADDVAFAMTMNTLTGPARRHDSTTIHHWHPVDLAHTYGHDKHREQYALVEAYTEAAGSIKKIRSVRFS